MRCVLRGKTGRRLAATGGKDTGSLPLAIRQFSSVASIRSATANESKRAQTRWWSVKERLVQVRAMRTALSSHPLCVTWRCS
jgi:hypothetical protein